MTWSISGRHPIPVATARVNVKQHASILFLGDLHLDSSRADRGVVKRLLDEAVDREALIVLLGDVFDVMQGHMDRRATLAALKKEYAGDSGGYLGAVLDDVTTFLKPYAKHIWVILQGNHESSVLKYAGVRIEQLLAVELNRAGGSISTPGYQTYAAVRLTKGLDKENERYTSVPFWIAHGHGGGGEVTKGVIQAQRRAVTYPDARFVVSGHVHSSYFVAHDQWRLMHSTLRPYATEQEHYVVNTFKDEFSGGMGYHVEKGRGPKTPSGWWVRFYRKHNRQMDQFAWAFERAT